MPESKTSIVAKQLVFKNKCLFILCMTFIIVALFGVCYLFFFRTVHMDVTKNIDIVYQGESGFAKIQVSTKESNVNQRLQEFIDSIEYRVTPNYNLSNGDEVIIEAYYDQGIANKYNIDVVNPSKTITIENLATRYVQASELKPELLDSLSNHGETYITKNMDIMLKTDFTQFYVTSKTEFVKKELLHRVFLKSANIDNKDKVADIYQITAKGSENVGEGKEELVETEKSIYYIVTYDDINTSNLIKDENVYGEKLITLEEQELRDETTLSKVLNSKFLLSYDIQIVK